MAGFMDSLYDSDGDLTKKGKAGAAAANAAGSLVSGAASKKSSAGQAAGGVLSGVGAGAAFGAPGMIIGGVVGGVSGLLGAAAERKRLKLEAGSKFRSAQNAAEQKESQQKQQALSGLRASFAKSLLTGAGRDVGL